MVGAAPSPYIQCMRPCFKGRHAVNGHSFMKLSKSTLTRALWLRGVLCPPQPLSILSCLKELRAVNGHSLMIPVIPALCLQVTASGLQI